MSGTAYDNNGDDNDDHHKCYKVYDDGDANDDKTMIIEAAILLHAKETEKGPNWEGQLTSAYFCYSLLQKPSAPSERYLDVSAADPYPRLLPPSLSSRNVSLPHLLLPRLQEQQNALNDCFRVFVLLHGL